MTLPPDTLPVLDRTPPQSAAKENEWEARS